MKRRLREISWEHVIVLLTSERQCHTHKCKSRKKGLEKEKVKLQKKSFDSRTRQVKERGYT